MKNLTTAVFLLLITSVFYFSWLPSPDLSHAAFLPDWLSVWTNKHDIWRTAIPFLLLGIIAPLLPNIFAGILPFLRFSLVLVFAAEFVQFFLPQRHFDIYDIIVALIGAFVGYILGRFFQYRFQF
jgi:VanZ family protein